MPRWQHLAYAGSIIATIALLSACSSGSSKGSGSATSGPNPNATESNVAGDIPDNQAFVPYADPGKAFTVTVPEGWARTSSGAGALFTDKYNSVRIETKATATAPTVASAQATDLPAIQAAAKDFHSGKVSMASRKAGPAVLITYQADSAPNPVTGKVAVEAVERYEFWKSGHEVILTLAAPVGSDNVDPWRTVTDTFTWSA
jgi:hypothetical protein